jgi:hypothetical protein
LGRFELGQKRVDLVNVLKTAAEKAVVHQVAHLKKAFIMEEKGQHIIKVKICGVFLMGWQLLIVRKPFSRLRSPNFFVSLRGLFIGTKPTFFPRSLSENYIFSTSATSVFTHQTSFF